MTAPRSSALLIGVGNPFRGDDGVGGVVIRRLRGQNLPGFTILEETGDGAELLEAWQGASAVILVDAVQSGVAPGTIHRLDAVAEKLPKWFSHCSTHAFGVAEAIELARTLGELPPSLIVYGIEGLDFSAGTSLSPEVAASVPGVVSSILAEIRGLAGFKSARIA
jgi:hydrogenase maturation protease